MAFDDTGVLGIFLRSMPVGTDQDPMLLFGTGLVQSNPECHRPTAADPYVCNAGGGSPFTFDNTFAYGSGFYDNNYPGFGGGVLDRAGNAVPEPAVWAFMIVGFASVGAVLRRRRRLAAA
jgi:hypothetical protein